MKKEQRSKLAIGKKVPSLSIVAKKSTETAFNLSIGKVIDEVGNTGKVFSTDINNLNKHALICGVTGSGKTNTCFHLLQQLWQEKIPFLVIEPAKSEYRHLMLDSKVFRGDGQVYTLGDEATSPLRLNPFEIMKGVKVSVHIEALKSIFNASFDMYAPMPQVLEKALNSIYTVRGWDLVQNKNLRLPEGVAPGDPNCPAEIYPTMKDLYEIIGPMTESFAYSERIGPDVSAALNARIGGLLSGSKGEIFSRRSSKELTSLFSKPVVVELKHLVNDDEKTFFTSVLLLFLSEYREIQGLKSGLEHILVMEDGHRLLKKKHGGTSSTNSSSNFVDIFANALSEMRSYGEGMIVVAQNPGQLMPEIMSNTNLKIIHRLVTTDDINAVYGGTYLNEADKNLVIALAAGEALAYQESMHEPQHLQIVDVLKDIKIALTSKDSDAIVQKVMAAKPEPYRHLGCDLCHDPTIFSLATVVASDPIFRLTYNNYILSTSKDHTQLVHGRANIIHQIQRILGRKERTNNIVSVTWCALCQATERYFDRKGEDNYWPYDQVKQQKLAWLNLIGLAFKPTSEAKHLDIKMVKEWHDNFTKLQQREQGPLPTCGPCTSKCLYRFEVAEAVRDPKVKYDFNSVLNRKDTPTSDSAAWFCQLLAERLSGQPDLDLSYCLAVHLIKDQQLSNDAQLVLVHKVRTALEKFRNENATTTVKDL